MSGIQPFGELLFVKEISPAFLVAKDKPVLAVGSGRLPFFQESAERSDAGAGCHHDDGSRGIGGWFESVRVE